MDFARLLPSNIAAAAEEVMTGITTLQFALRLTLAIGMGSMVGLERQWRQRMAGTRTNALVAAGAAAFIMSGYLLEYDPSARGRIASYIVSGVGFLGAGVIFKDGSNVRGLNTAATIWCSAAIGLLNGLGAIHLALALAVGVLLTNTVLRPLAYRLNPALPEASPLETLYEIRLTCKESAVSHLRSLLLTTIARAKVTLQAIQSEEEEDTNLVHLRAEMSTLGRNNEAVEQIVVRLSIEEAVATVGWSIVKSTLE